MEFPKKNFEKKFKMAILFLGGFPIEIETQTSKLITYSLAIFIL